MESPSQLPIPPVSSYEPTPSHLSRFPSPPPPPMITTTTTTTTTTHAAIRGRPQPLGNLPSYSTVRLSVEDRTPTTPTTPMTATTATTATFDKIPLHTSTSPLVSSSSSSHQMIHSIPHSQHTLRKSHPGCTLCSKYELACTSISSNQDKRFHSSHSNSSSINSNPLSSSITPLQPYSIQDDPGFISTQTTTTTSRNVRTNSTMTRDDTIFVDEDFLVYRVEGNEAVCKNGKHLVIVLARHLEDVYDLGPPDVPLLNKIQQVVRHILESIPDDGSNVKGRGKGNADETENSGKHEIRIGFIVSPFRDSLHSHKHLHLHALIPPLDNASFIRRNFAFGGLWAPGSVGWWELEDLIAEIREDSSNNRIKSGYGGSRKNAPIVGVMDAGSAHGHSNALETSNPPTRSFSALIADQSREVSILEKRRDEYLSEETDERYPVNDEEMGRGVWKSVEMNSPNLEVFQMGHLASDSRRNSWVDLPEVRLDVDGITPRTPSPLSGAHHGKGQRERADFE